LFKEGFKEELRYMLREYLRGLDLTYVDIIKGLIPFSYVLGDIMLKFWILDKADHPRISRFFYRLKGFDLCQFILEPYPMPSFGIREQKISFGRRNYILRHT
jgi:hypothetical protein